MGVGAPDCHSFFILGTQKTHSLPIAYVSNPDVMFHHTHTPAVVVRTVSLHPLGDWWAADGPLVTHWLCFVVVVVIQDGSLLSIDQSSISSTK